MDILWLDGGWVQPMTPTSPRWGKNPCDQNIDMPKIAAMARSLQPGLIIVDRAVEGRYQNYRTPEQESPRHGAQLRLGNLHDHGHLVELCRERRRTSRPGN